MRFLLLFTMLMWAFSTSAQPITHFFEVKHYTITSENEHSIISIPGTRKIAAAGDPAQPYFLANILLPPGTKLSDVKIEAENLKTIKLSHDLMPMQHVQPISFAETHGFIKNSDTYKQVNYLSFEQSLIMSQERMNGYEIAQIKFSPIEYYPLSQTIKIAQKIRLVVNHENSGKAALKMLSGRRDVHNRILDFCDNTDVKNTYKSLKVAKSGQTDALIITPDEFTPDFESLIEDYQLRGITTEILTTETIQSEYGGNDFQEKIRNAIIDYYQNRDVFYVLLGGDVEHIPHRGFYCQVQSSSVYEDDDIPADLYYMALDGNWNTDGDDNWAEPDEDDLIPEVALARLPFTTHDELAKMLNKAAMYTNQPVTGELNNPLLAGEHLYSDPLTWGAQYLDLIHGNHDDNGYSTIGIPDTHPYDTMYDRNATWSSGELINEINNGHPFIHHVGHSNTNYAMRLYSSDITNANFDQVNGITHNFPLIYTHGCICGAFDADDCIGEEMIQIDNFAVAFVGNSRYGWFNEGQTEGPSQHLHREFVSALYGDSIQSLAEAHLISKIETSGWVEAPNQHEHGALRWCFYDCNVLGDPLLPIWTNDPRNIEVNVPGNVYVGESEITVTVNESGQPVKNADIAIKINDANPGAGQTDSTGTAIISLNAPFSELGEVDIITSGYNILKDTTQVTLQRPQTGYLIVEAITLGDDNQPIYGHEYTPTLTLENVGESVSTSTLMVVSCNSPYITITDSALALDPVDALQQTSLSAAFGMHINDTIPDQENIELNFHFYEDDELTHSMHKNLQAMSPNLNWENITLSDDTGGNGNGIFDPGEVITLQATLINSGSIAPAMIETHISHTSKAITILNDTVQYIPGQDENNYLLEFAIQADNEDSSGSNLSLNIGGHYDHFQLEEIPFHCIIGQAIEDFETGDFTQYDWQNDATNPWETTDIDPMAGNYSSCSPDIDDDELTELSITMDVPEDDSISFWYKVSCEDGSSYLWDYLEFSINGTSMDTWDGEVPWSKASYAVSAGTQTFKWTYTKDFTVSSGQDCAWIDNIVFPVPGYIPPDDNLPPEITADDEINVAMGETFTHAVTATDPENDPLTGFLLMAPDWINMEETATNEWQISGIIPVAMELLPDIIAVVGDTYQYSAKTFYMNTEQVSTNEIEKPKSNIYVYPQPADDFIYVEWQENKPVQSIQVISADGKIMKTRRLNEHQNKIKIALGQLPGGLYLIHIQTNGGENQSKKIIVK